MTPRMIIPLITTVLFITTVSLLATAGIPPASADPAPDPLATGRTLLAQNDREHAITELESAAAAHPTSPEAYALLATAYLRYGMADKGLQAAQTASRLADAATPADRAEASFLLGRAQLQVYEQSRRAIAKKYGGPQTGSGVENPQSSHEETREGTPATGSGIGATFDPVTSGDSKDSEISENELNPDGGSVSDTSNAGNQELSDAFEKLDHSLPGIEKSFRNTLAADPSYPDAHDGLGLILAMEGKPKDALTEFQAETKRDPADLPALSHLAGVQAQQDDRKSAIATYLRITRYSPRDAETYAHLAELYSKQKDSPDEQWAKGMAFTISGDYPLAQAAFVNVKTPTGPILRGEAMLAIAQGQFASAQPLLAKALALAPNDADSLAVLGDTQFHDGKLQDALSSYTKATQNDPSNAAAWYGIGLTQDKLNDPTDAMAAYGKALAANPNSAAARLNLAADQIDANQKTDALANLREYQKRFPTASDAADIENLILQLTTT